MEWERPRAPLALITSLFKNHRSKANPKSQPRGNADLQTKSICSKPVCSGGLAPLETQGSVSHARCFVTWQPPPTVRVRELGFSKEVHSIYGQHAQQGRSALFSKPLSLFPPSQGFSIRLGAR